MWQSRMQVPIHICTHVVRGLQHAWWMTCREVGMNLYAWALKWLGPPRLVMPCCMVEVASARTRFLPAIAVMYGGSPPRSPHQDVCLGFKMVGSTSVHLGSWCRGVWSRCRPRGDEFSPRSWSWMVDDLRGVRTKVYASAVKWLGPPWLVVPWCMVEVPSARTRVLSPITVVHGG